MAAETRDTTPKIQHRFTPTAIARIDLATFTEIGSPVVRFGIHFHPPAVPYNLLYSPRPVRSHHMHATPKQPVPSTYDVGYSMIVYNDHIYITTVRST